MGLVIAITILSANTHDNAVGIALFDQVADRAGGSVSEASVDQGLLGRRTDILASNRMARVLSADFDGMPRQERNFARWMFLDNQARALFVDWEDQARAAVASLRLEVGRDPHDQATTALVDELRVRSPEFGQWWEQHRVHQRTHGSKHLHHPLAGDLTVEHKTLTLLGDPDTTLFLYTAEVRSSSKRALDLLDSRTLTSPAGRTGPPAQGLT